MRNIIWLLAVTMIIGLICPSVSDAESFIKLKGLGWDSTLNGKIRADKDLMTGSSIDFKDTLGIKDSVIVPEVEGKIGFLGTSRWIISGSTASYEGEKVISNNLSFAGKTFLASETLKTQLDVSMISAMYEFAPIPEGVTAAVTSTEPEMGLLLGLKYFHTEAQITSDSTGAVKKETFGLPIPVVGLRVQGRIAENIQLESAGTWMKIRSSTTDITMSWSDLYGELKFSFVPKMPFGFGYKLNKLGIDADIGQPFFSRFEFKGWYLMASLEL
ncbi:MAG: hypothetical protein HZA49_05075 [Planctomycetes bacterium]|nr:hypothetical protein [Planctomycetota bacterium]